MEHQVSQSVVIQLHEMMLISIPVSEGKRGTCFVQRNLEREVDEEVSMVSTWRVRGRSEGKELCL